MKMRIQFRCLSAILIGSVLSTAITGCGGDSTASTATAGTQAKSNAESDDKEVGKPPERDKLPSDDLFASMVKSFVEGKGDAYQKSEQALDKLGAEAIPTYCDALRGGGVESRKLACMRLAVLGPDAAPATEELSAALNDEEAFVRANAASVLSVVSNPPEQLVSSLLKILNDQEANEWHGMSIVALANLGTLATDAVPVMQGFLKHTDPIYRRDALLTLRAIGPDAKKILGDIKALTKDENEEVRETATSVVKFLESIDRKEETPNPDKVDLNDKANPGDNGPPPPLPTLELGPEEKDPEEKGNDEKGEENSTAQEGSETQEDSKESDPGPPSEPTEKSGK